MSDLIKISDFAKMDLVETQTVCNSIKTFEQLHSVTMPSLNFMVKQHGEDKIQALIELKIEVCLDFFNLKQTMSTTQRELTASLILSEYQWLTIPDIDICFKNAMLGAYGKLYAAIDGQVILLWFKQYALDRSNAMEDLSLIKHHELKGKKEIHPEILEAFKSVIKAKEDKPRRHILEPNKAQKQAWALFERINKSQKKKLPKTNIPMIEVKGMHYTADGFSAFYFKRLNERNRTLGNN